MRALVVVVLVGLLGCQARVETTQVDAEGGGLEAGKPEPAEPAQPVSQDERPPRDYLAEIQAKLKEATPKPPDPLVKDYLPIDSQMLAWSKQYAEAFLRLIPYMRKMDKGEATPKECQRFIAEVINVRISLPEPIDASLSYFPRSALEHFEKAGTQCLNRKSPDIDLLLGRSSLAVMEKNISERYRIHVCLPGLSGAMPGESQVDRGKLCPQ